MTVASLEQKTRIISQNHPLQVRRHFCLFAFIFYNDKKSKINITQYIYDDLKIKLLSLAVAIKYRDNEDSSGD